MDTRSGRAVGLVGTIAAVVGACWLALLADHGFVKGSSWPPSR
ncbi:hypothetical protein [Micromonospora sp. URMC 103]